MRPWTVYGSCCLSAPGSEVVGRAPQVAAVYMFADLHWRFGYSSPLELALSVAVSRAKCESDLSRLTFWTAESENDSHLWRLSIGSDRLSSRQHYQRFSGEGNFPGYRIRKVLTLHAHTRGCGFLRHLNVQLFALAFRATLPNRGMAYHPSFLPLLLPLERILTVFHNHHSPR